MEDYLQEDEDQECEYPYNEDGFNEEGEQCIDPYIV